MTLTLAELLAMLGLRQLGMVIEVQNRVDGEALLDALRGVNWMSAKHS